MTYIGNNFTLKDVGPDYGQGNSESGWAREELLMGGEMGVEWNGEVGTVGLIEHIDILYLEKSGTLRLIGKYLASSSLSLILSFPTDHDAAQLMIDSLIYNHPRLKSPQSTSLKDHPSELQQGALRGRLFLPSERVQRTVSNIPPPIGLGITSARNPPVGVLRSLVGGNCRM